MKVIKPNTISTNSIVSSTLTETEQAWSSASSYVIGNIVYDGLDGIYTAITDNTNKRPSLSPLDWMYLRPSNSWAMFDQQVSTVSTAGAQGIEVVLKTGAIEAFAVLNVEAASTVEIIVTDGPTGPVIYEGIQNLAGDVSNWYEYFFFDIGIRRTQAVFLGIPSGYINTYTTLKVLTDSTSVKVGICTFGKVVELGSSEYGFTSGITDYSKKDTDDFGTTTFVRRAYSKRISGRILIQNAMLNKTQRTLYELRATPALWFASQNPTFEEALVVYGYYRDFSTDISYPGYSYCSLDIEGLI